MRRGGAQTAFRFKRLECGNRATGAAV